jgi:hypothetical protein
MRDRDVRLALHSQLLREHADDLDSTRFVDELCLCGEVRVDVAVVNAALSGFELKSASDTLRRFPTQVQTYSRVLDYCTIVVAENHLDRAVDLIPSWWGCTAVRWDGERATLDEVTPAERNPAVEGYALAQLLWRDETLAALERVNAAKGVRSKPRKVLWERLSEAIELDELRLLVRNVLKSRSGWRPEATSIQSGRELAAGDAACRLLPRFEGRR